VAGRSTRSLERTEQVDAPGQVKTAIAVSWVVFLADTGDAVWKIALDQEARTDSLFLAVWLGVTVLSAAITAALIWYASRRRNWARIAFLVWTLAYWMYWVVWPPEIESYPWWKWAITASLMASQAVALVLLFTRRSGNWYYTKSGAAGAL
jgi:hypothetical protein